MRMTQPKYCQMLVTSMLVLLIGIGLLLAFQSSVSAQDVNALAKEADNELRQSHRLMFNGKFEEALKHLQKAAELIAQIKAIDPAFPQLKTLESKYEKQQKDLERRMPKEKPAEPVAGTQPEQPASQTDKLPSTVKHYLENVDRIVAQGENALARKSLASPDERIKGFEMTLKEANGVMERIFSSYGDQFDHEHPDVKARQEKIAAFQAKVEEFKANIATQQAQAAEADVQRKAQSNEWLDNIKPYVTGVGQSGHDEHKYLIGSGTSNVDELVHRKTIYKEAKALFEAYQQVEFPFGKTQELEFAEADLARALKGFEEGYQETLERFTSEAAKELDRAEQWLTNQEAQSAGEQKPVYLHRDVIQGIKNTIFALEAATSGEDSSLQALNDRLANVEKRAQQLRQLGVERTLMIPDTFKGPEINTLKTKAAEFLHKEHPDAKILRTTIISEDWSEERQWEYTDTTKTAVRYRITRSVTAQIAGKSGNEVFLYIIYIAKDQRSDGSWGELYGHVMFTDPMLEENVNK